MPDAPDTAACAPVDPMGAAQTARALAERATSLLLSRPPGVGTTRLGVVDGPSGSGKSTFALVWEQVLLERGCGSVFLFSSDLLATWSDPFGWYARFDTDVLAALAIGKPGRIQLTDWSSGAPRPGCWLDIPVVDVLLLEGVSASRQALGGRVGVSVWLDVASRAQRLERAVARDGESSRRNLTRWQHAEQAFFEQDRPVDRADFRVDGSIEMELSDVPGDQEGPKVASRLPGGMLAP